MKRNPKTLLPHIVKRVNKSNTGHKFSNVRVLQDNSWAGMVQSFKPFPIALTRLGYAMETSSDETEDTPSRPNKSRNHRTNMNTIL